MTTDPPSDAVRIALRACPLCGRPVEARFRPFCSKRCADIDLGRWMMGSYRVETSESPRETGDEDGDER